VNKTANQSDPIFKKQMNLFNLELKSKPMDLQTAGIGKAIG